MHIDLTVGGPGSGGLRRRRCVSLSGWMTRLACYRVVAGVGGRRWF